MGGQVIETFADKVIKEAEARVQEAETRVQEAAKEAARKEKATILRMNSRGLTPSEISYFTGYDPSFIAEVLSSADSNEVVR